MLLFKGVSEGICAVCRWYLGHWWSAFFVVLLYTFVSIEGFYLSLIDAFSFSFPFWISVFIFIFLLGPSFFAGFTSVLRATYGRAFIQFLLIIPSGFLFFYTIYISCLWAINKESV